MSSTAIQILLSLKSSRRYMESFIAPLDLTQEGLTSRIGVDRGNISRALNILMSSGFVTAEMKHIANKKRRCRAYYLTEKGLLEINQYQDMSNLVFHEEFDVAEKAENSFSGFSRLERQTVGI